MVRRAVILLILYENKYGEKRIQKHIVFNIKFKLRRFLEYIQCGNLNRKEMKYYSCDRYYKIVIK